MKNYQPTDPIFLELFNTVQENIKSIVPDSFSEREKLRAVFLSFCGIENAKLLTPTELRAVSKEMGTFSSFMDRYDCIIDANIMCPNHPNWKIFITRLGGSKGCNLRRIKDCDVWDCDNTLTRPITSKILLNMGMNVEASLSYFKTNNGCCDCKVLFNVG